MKPHFRRLLCFQFFDNSRFQVGILVFRLINQLADLGHLHWHMAVTLLPLLKYAFRRHLVVLKVYGGAGRRARSLEFLHAFSEVGRGYRFGLIWNL